MKIPPSRRQVDEPASEPPASDPQQSGQNEPQPDPNEISRRSLLAASAGATLGSMLWAGEVAADHGTTHGNRKASLSSRVYPSPGDEILDIAKPPTDLPPPIKRRKPQTIQFDVETVELEGRLDQNSTFRYWTFNGTVPGPFLRARVGDTVEVRLRNHPESWMVHNIDIHAVTGPGGGAEATFASPGEAKGFRFKAMHPGIYVYHCAVPPVAQHIANGMYGLALIEPEDGLDPVDREFYVMQGEIYTAQPFGTAGLLDEDYQKLLDETPEFFVFNGHVGALTDHYPMKARVGEKVRIFYGNGGPNRIASFHIIGEIFNRIYLNGSITSPPLLDAQTALVPAGGAVMAELKFDVPGRYVLVDHSLSRAERGLAAWIDVEGKPNPEIFTPIKVGD